MSSLGREWQLMNRTNARALDSRTVLDERVKECTLRAARGSKPLSDV